MAGVDSELFVYLATDPSDGVTGVGFMETASSSRVPLLAESRRKAEALKPIVERLAGLTGATFRLVRFTLDEQLDEIKP